jgi:hypothetical protein
MEKRKLSFLANLEHEFRFLGIQFGFACNKVECLEFFKPKADVDDIPGLWLPTWVF